ncbi:26782_t:CDS:2, partial [Dentiscutata erythropus]
LRYWNRGIEVVLLLDRHWSFSESPLLELLLLESEWSHITGVLLVEWSRITGLVVVYGTVGFGISLVDPCWSDSSICGVGIRSIFLGIIAEVSVFGL